MDTMDREAGMAMATDLVSTPEESSQRGHANSQQLFTTPFGDLTEDEVGQWEKMLGHPLQKVLKKGPEN
jgi:hypothetical protein